MTKVLTIQLMGPLELALDGRPLTNLSSGKALALLSYLVTTGRPYSRQALAGLLWGELPEADGRRNLRGVLMRLKQHLADYLIITHQTLAFNSDSNYWLDVEAFRHSLEQRPGGPHSAASLDEAVALYRGDFLEDLHLRRARAFEEWVLAQRTQLRELALNACRVLAVYYTEQEMYQQGINHARRLLELDPVREDGWRQLMILLALNGQRNVALSEFEVCRHVLDDELGVAPAPATVALYERIRANEVGREVSVERAIPYAVAVSGEARPQRATPAIDGDDLPPFVAGPPITHPRHFFGRKRELRRLFNMLKRLPLQNAAIIGPRRSGKTSLLHYLKTISSAVPEQVRPGQRLDWLPRPAHYRWIFVDFQDPRLGSAEALMRHLLSQMGLPVPASCNLVNFLDTVIDGLHSPTVILFDEIGVAMQRYHELDDAFWESLRSLATNQVGGNLGFVLASPESPDQLARKMGLGSPFFNIFAYSAVLGPLSEAEARELIDSSPLAFAEEDVAWMLWESGRWPILLQILCRERLLTLEEGESGDAWREDAMWQMAPFKRALMGED